MDHITRPFEGLRELALFAGIGGGILGGHLLGWRTVCAVERDLYAASVLAQRQNDGHLPPFPIWSDVCSFDGSAWRGAVDVVSGGFPCQDISLAGKGAGIGGERSGLWGEMARIVREVEPRFVFVENVAALTGRGLDRVLRDLAEIGYDAEWCVLSAADVGAPHVRERIWILGYDVGYGRQSGWDDNGAHDGHIACATGEHPNPISHTNGSRLGANEQDLRTRQSNATRSGNVSNPDAIGCETGRLPLREVAQISEPAVGGEDDAHTNSAGRQEQHAPGFAANPGQRSRSTIEGWGAEWWAAEPDVGRVAANVPFRVDRIKCLGNAQVPLQAATAFCLLYERIRGLI